MTFDRISEYASSSKKKKKEFENKFVFPVTADERLVQLKIELFTHSGISSSESLVHEKILFFSSLMFGRFAQVLIKYVMLSRMKQQKF